ncbi:MAG: DUF3306 domain-containing protein [Rhodospirillales bacterium]
MSNDRGFLGRWSRLKQVDREAKAEQPEAAMEEEVPAAPVPAAADDSERVTAPAEADVGELPDIESLTRDSDYTAFMREGVPEDLRNLALRKLWRSDPVFANLDGLNDYDEDFRMVSMAGEVMKSTWKVGSGYDEPEPDPEVAGEEMEDLDSASAGAGEPDVAPEGEPADEASGEDGMFPDGGKA